MKNIIIATLLVICAVLSVLSVRQAAYIKKYIPKEKLVRRYKVAIVIDDFGYNTKNLEGVFSLGIPVTLAVLPNLPYSKYISEKAKTNGLEVILHLPLEPHEDEGHSVHVERDTIYCNMKKKEVLSRLDDFLKSVPDAKGISNHMGSKATENEALMKIIFNEMRKKRLYFMDSLVTQKSVCKRLAKLVNLRYTKRDVFLDNENNPEYIKGQLLKLSDIAIQKGHAVGVGHDRQITIDTIKENIPELKKKGIEFVFASRLAKQ